MLDRPHSATLCSVSAAIYLQYRHKSSTLSHTATSDSVTIAMKRVVADLKFYHVVAVHTCVCVDTNLRMHRFNSAFTSIRTACKSVLLRCNRAFDICIFVSLANSPCVTAFNLRILVFESLNLFNISNQYHCIGNLEAVVFKI